MASNPFAAQRLTELLQAQLNDSSQDVATLVGNAEFLREFISTMHGASSSDWPKRSTDSAGNRWAVKFEDGQMCRYNAQQVSPNVAPVAWLIEVGRLRNGRWWVGVHAPAREGACSPRSICR